LGDRLPFPFGAGGNFAAVQLMITAIALRRNELKATCQRLRFLLVVIGMLSVANSGFAAQPVFVSSESVHLIVHYVKGTAAEKDLSQLIANREAAYEAITHALGVAPDRKLEVYLYPTRESTESLVQSGMSLKIRCF
jgi:hypothetical protein